MENQYLKKIIAQTPADLQIISACCSEGKVNIDDVKYFISNNEPIHNIDGVLSNKDLKFLNKNLDQTLDFFN